jgi:hypothetical protein
MSRAKTEGVLFLVSQTNVGHFQMIMVLKIKTEMLDFMHFKTTLNFDWPGRTVTKLLQQYRNLQHHRSNIRIISYHP